MPHKFVQKENLQELASKHDARKFLGQFFLSLCQGYDVSWLPGSVAYSVNLIV